MIIGDAAHTAHFSIGSGTRLAMEDAIALERALHDSGDDIGTALPAYEAARRPIVEKIVRGALAKRRMVRELRRPHGAGAAAISR